MDYAHRLTNGLAQAGSQRADYARGLAARMDANGDAQVSRAEFQQLFATLLADPTRMPEVTGAVGMVHRTLFAETLYPSFSRNHAIAAYLAQEAVTALDLDASGSVALAELDGTAKPPAPPTPAQRADDLMQRYDTSGKGYVNLADIQAAWSADPTLGDPTKAQAALDAFDQNGDGQVTHDELAAAYTAMDQADAMLAVFDSTGTGSINIAAAAQNSSADYPDAQASFARWDANQDGTVTRVEMIAGLEADAAAAKAAAQQPTPTPPSSSDMDPALLAATLLAQYDTDHSGGISSDEFVTHAQVADTASTFAAWDVNGDGDLTLEELQTGIAQVQQAQNIVKQYDTAGKGYFDEADLIAAIDPSTVDNVADRAKQIMAFWDANGDGQVSVAEVVSGIEAGGYVGGEQLKTATPTA